MPPAMAAALSLAPASARRRSTRIRARGRWMPSPRVSMRTSMSCVALGAAWYAAATEPSACRVRPHPPVPEPPDAGIPSGSLRNRSSTPYSSSITRALACRRLSSGWRAMMPARRISRMASLRSMATRTLAGPNRRATLRSSSLEGRFLLVATRSRGTPRSLTPPAPSPTFPSMITVHSMCSMCCCCAPRIRPEERGTVRVEVGPI